MRFAKLLLDHAVLGCWGRSPGILIDHLIILHGKFISQISHPSVPLSDVCRVCAEPITRVLVGEMFRCDLPKCHWSIRVLKCSGTKISDENKGSCCGFCNPTACFRRAFCHFFLFATETSSAMAMQASGYRSIFHFESWQTCGQEDVPDQT